MDEAFERRSADAGPIRRFSCCLPILRSREPSAPLPQPLPSGSPVATHHADQDPPAPDAELPRSAPVEVAGGTSAEAHVSDPWDAAMERAIGKVRKAGWPISDALQMALRAKAVRVDDVACQHGADEPGWAGDALLLALGRKMGKGGRQTPTEEQLLAYADGILANWAHRGQPGAGSETQPLATSHPRPGSAHRDWHAELSQGHQLHREPKSDAERLWDQILRDLQLQMARAAFDHCLRGSELLELHRPEEAVARLVIKVGSSHAVDWLEHRLKPVIRRTVERRLGQEANLTFHTGGQSTHRRDTDATSHGKPQSGQHAEEDSEQ